MKENILSIIYNVIHFCIPTAHADALTWEALLKYDSAQMAALLVTVLLDVFFYAGILLLVYAIIMFILALKDESADGKANAISKMSVALVCITFSTLINGLLSAAGVSGVTF